MTSSANAETLELGGYAGITATNTRTTYDCPDVSPPGVCTTMSSPGHGMLGPVLGAYVRYAVTRHVRVEADLLYSTKGYDSGPKVRFHYIEVPLLVRFSTAENASGGRAFIHGGVAPAILAWCHNSGIAFDNDKHEPFAYSGSCAEGPVLDRTPSRFDLGVEVGAGVGWNLDAGILDLELRFTRSLLDIEPNEAGTTVNHAFVLLAGFGRRSAPDGRHR